MKRSKPLVSLPRTNAEQALVTAQAQALLDTRAHMTSTVIGCHTILRTSDLTPMMPLNGLEPRMHLWLCLSAGACLCPASR